MRCLYCRSVHSLRNCPNCGAALSEELDPRPRAIGAQQFGSVCWGDSWGDYQMSPFVVPQVLIDPFSEFGLGDKFMMSFPTPEGFRLQTVATENPRPRTAVKLLAESIVRLRCLFDRLF